MKTETVNIEKWYIKNGNQIKCDSEPICDIWGWTADEERANYTAELITTAVNSCKEVNKDNPLNVAKAIPEMFKALEALQEMFVHREGETEKNKIKTNMIKYCDEVKEALNKSREAIYKATKQ